MTKKHLAWATGAVMACAALPAAAQDCGGVGAGGIWIGGGPGASDISTAADYQEQLALVLLGNQYVSLFSVSNHGDYRLEAEGRGAGDPIIELFDNAGNSVMTDDDGGGGTSSRIETALSPGNYCLAMSSFDGSPMTGTVRIGRSEHEPLTAGFTAGGGGAPAGAGCENAVPLAAGSLNAQLAAGLSATNSINSTPAYSISLDAPAMITVTAENENADPVLTILDGNGVLLAENDDFDGLNSRIDMSQPLQPGDYCISLSALSDGNAPVTVSVSEFDPAEALRIQYNNGEISPPLDGSHPVTNLGTVTTRTRQDSTTQGGIATWYSFEVQDSGLMLIEVIGAGGGDPVITLFDDLGREVGYNDDGGEGLDSLLAVKINPGTYVLGLNDLNEASGLMRVVLERYVPAR
ncbi:DVUA0089 family protein [Aestuariibius sp. HNIBRBA575]|uniref:DVUA0089 family protein n=1 Tax=Aestuariibius sp. HNIBRBA575 TaxID=3233343 RepID=UPI0034A4ADFC